MKWQVIAEKGFAEKGFDDERKSADVAQKQYHSGNGSSHFKVFRHDVFLAGVIHGRPVFQNRIYKLANMLGV